MANRKKASRVANIDRSRVGAKQKGVIERDKNLISLDSGAIARLPFSGRSNRGPFDFGIVCTLIFYVILIILITISFGFLIGFVVILAIDSNTQPVLKFLGIVMSSTILLASFLILCLFVFQHVREQGWFSSMTGTSKQHVSPEDARINALYSIDPSRDPALVEDQLESVNYPVSPGNLYPRYAQSPYATAPMNITYV